MAAAYVVTTRRDQSASVRHQTSSQRRFTATAANQLWVADMTYVPTWAGFIYLGHRARRLEPSRRGLVDRRAHVRRLWCSRRSTWRSSSASPKT